MHNLPFKAAHFFLLRVPSWPVEKLEEIWNEKDYNLFLPDFFCNHPFLREAIALASPSLFEALNKSNHYSSQTSLSLLNYMNRLVTRTTPFGLFASVAMGNWEEKTNISFNSSRLQKRTRPDMGWLFSHFMQELGKTTEPFKLLIRCNPLALSKGNRVYLSYIRESEVDEKAKQTSVSIRASKLVYHILELSRQEIQIIELIDKLKKIFPNLDIKKTYKLINDLISQQFILPSQLPSLLMHSPIKALLDNWSDENLTCIFQEIKRYDEAKLGSEEDLLCALQKKMRQTLQAKNYLQVDAVHQGNKPILSKSILPDLERSVFALWKISSLYPKSATIQEIHAEFLNQYGVDRTVPLLQLMNEACIVKGLVQPKQEQEKSDECKSWERFLNYKWQDSLLNKSHEIVITEDEIDRICGFSTEKNLNADDLPYSFDVFFKMIAKSQEQLDQGNFLIQLQSNTEQGGSSFGRFTHLFDTSAQKKLEDYVHLEESSDSEAIFFEMAYFPKSVRSANVGIHPCMRKYRLDLNGPAKSSNCLSLSDIYVGASLDRLYLTLKNGEKELIPRVGNLLSPTFAPEPLQLMREIGRYRHKQLYPFSWFNLEKTAYFLPRVRFDKTIFSPARWNFLCSSYSGKSTKTFSTQLLQFAQKWTLPKKIYFQNGDNQLLINLDNELQTNYLKKMAQNSEVLSFSEYLDTSWIQGDQGHHHGEFVAPFTVAPAFFPKNPRIQIKPYRNVSFNDRWKLFGSEWLYLKIYLPEEECNRFLTEQLNSFVTDLAHRKLITEWHFLRFADPRHHIRLRLKIKSKDLSKEINHLVNLALNFWLSNQIILRSEISNYEREIERYGGLPNIELVEGLFCTDSIANIEILKLLSKNSHKIPNPIFYCLNIINLMKELDCLNKHHHFINHSIKKHLRGFNQYKSEILEYGSQLTGNPQKMHPIVRLLQQASKLRTHSIQELQTRAQGLSTFDFFEIYHSLIHMNCNRLGCNTEAESMARAYAARTLDLLNIGNCSGSVDVEIGSPL
ncbi:MAG: Nisin biosynthesis protein NisB [Chlamydiales bacterium]|nr:Nisin biosynthesis protein NisB [Chlamydiales bacterium]